MTKLVRFDTLNGKPVAVYTNGHEMACEKATKSTIAEFIMVHAYKPDMHSMALVKRIARQNSVDALIAWAMTYVK